MLHDLGNGYDLLGLWNKTGLSSSCKQSIIFLFSQQLIFYTKFAAESDCSYKTQLSALQAASFVLHQNIQLCEANVISLCRVLLCLLSLASAVMINDA